MLTGEPLTLFLDRDAIKWGEDWQKKVDSSLTLVAFFIPVLTPRYFMSPECRRELQFFARKTTQLGLKGLVLPLLYVDVPGLQDDAPADDLVALVRTFQWEDWRELRFSDVSAEAYRRGVARLAARLVDANRQAEKVDVATGASEALTTSAENEDDSPGFLDKMASAEDTLPKLTATITAISSDLELIGRTMEEATIDIQQRQALTSGFAARVLVARKVARLLAEPVERVWSLGNEYVSQLHEVDQGFRTIIERSTLELQQNGESKSAVCSFFGAVRSMSAAAHDGLNSAQGMIDAIGPIEGLSRDLRPVLRRLRQGLTTMVEAREVSDEWIGLIRESGIDCEELPAAAN
jgi:TIR domain